MIQDLTQIDTQLELGRKIQDILHGSRFRTHLMRTHLMSLHEYTINRSAPIYIREDISYALHKIKD